MTRESKQLDARRLEDVPIRQLLMRLTSSVVHLECRHRSIIGAKVDENRLDSSSMTHALIVRKRSEPYRSVTDMVRRRSALAVPCDKDIALIGLHRKARNDGSRTLVRQMLRHEVDRNV